VDLFLYTPELKEYFLFDQTGRASEIIIPKGKLQELKGNKIFNEENLSEYTRIILTFGKQKVPVKLEKGSGEIVRNLPIKGNKQLKNQAVLKFKISDESHFSMAKLNYFAKKESDWKERFIDSIEFS